MDLELIWLPNSCQNIISELQKRGTAVFLICININTQDCFRLKKTTENYISIYIYRYIYIGVYVLHLSWLNSLLSRQSGTGQRSQNASIQQKSQINKSAYNSYNWGAN